MKELYLEKGYKKEGTVVEKMYKKLFSYVNRND